jgi:DNA polymerase elongation subunit (family B)
MYQSVYFDRNEKQYYLRDDKKGWTSFKYYPTYYFPDYDGEFTTLEGNRVSPVKKIEDWQDTRYYEKDVDKGTRLLVDMYYETDDTPSFHNIVCLDIECVVAGALTPENIKDPKGEITAISLYDVNKKKYYCLILDKDNKMEETGNEDKHIMPFPSEKELLHAFLDKWMELDPTIIAGWNSGFFDIPYLYYRISKVLSPEIANYLSPLGKVHFTPQFPEQPVNLAGISHLDYMLLFKKYITKQEPSYKLGEIGKKYAKLVCVNKSGNVASAWGFIALEDGSINGHKHCAGDLLKPASFSRPTAISRGSICVTIGEKKGAPASFNVYGPDCVKSLKENLKEK